MRIFFYFIVSISLLSCTDDNRKISRKVPKDTVAALRQFIQLPDTSDYIFGPGEAKCINTHAYTLQERRQFFPFRKATKIQFVSFAPNGCLIEAPKYEISKDGLKYKPQPEVKRFCGLPNEKGRVEVAFLKEQITLTVGQINQLSAIIYNYDTESDEEEISGCYEPRNAVVFLGNNDELIAYLDICFECSGSKAKPAQFLIGEFCNDKYEALKKLFKEAGIQYGTEER